MEYKLEKYLNKLQNIEYDQSHPSYSIYMEKYMYYLTGGRKSIQSIFNRFVAINLVKDPNYTFDMNKNAIIIRNTFNSYIRNINIQRPPPQKLLTQDLNEIKILIRNYHNNKMAQMRKIMRPDSPKRTRKRLPRRTFQDIEREMLEKQQSQQGPPPIQRSPLP
jgi:hypothetical protein